MSNEKKLEELGSRLNTDLNYTEAIQKPKEKTVKPNLTRLKKLSQGFRESLEDYTDEFTVSISPTRHAKEQ